MATIEVSHQQEPNFDFTQIEGSQLDESQECSESDSEVEELEAPSAEAISAVETNQDPIQRTVMNEDVRERPNTTDVGKDVTDSGRGEAEPIVTFQSITGERSPSRCSAPNGDHLSVQEGPYNASDVSTLLDTPAVDEHKAEAESEEDEGGMWINANLASHSFVRKKRKSMEKNGKSKQERSRQSLSGAKENDANRRGPNPEAPETENQGPGELLDKIGKSSEQARIIKLLSTLVEEKEQLEEQLDAVVIPAVREAIKGMVAEKEKEIRKTNEILGSFNGIASDHTAKPGLSEPGRVPSKGAEDDEEELEEPLAKSSSERLIQAVYEQSNEEPSASQRQASDVLLSMSGTVPSPRRNKVAFDPAVPSSRGTEDLDEEAELEFQQSQEESPGRLQRLRKVSSSSKKPKKNRNSDEAIVEAEDEGERAALGVHQIPLTLLQEIEERGVDTVTLHSGEWKSLIGKELVAAGWEWRGSSGLETGWRLIRPGVGKRDAKELQHYTHYIMDEEVSIYVSISVDHPHLSSASHQNHFFQLLDQYNNKPRSRRGMKPPVDEIMPRQASAKPNPVSYNKGGKKGRTKQGTSKDSSPRSAKKRKTQSSSPEHVVGASKRVVKPNARHRDYVDVDTQYLDNMEVYDSDSDTCFEMTQAQAQVSGSSSESFSSRSEGPKTPQQLAAEAKCRSEARVPSVQVSNPVENSSTNSIARQPSLMNMNSGGSLMFVGLRFCFSGVEKEQQRMFQDAVQRHAGKVISTIDDLRDQLQILKEERECGENEGLSSQREDSRVIVLSHPHMYRREKFLISLACPNDTLMLHPQWLIDCVKSNKQVHHSPYLLPSGSSLVRPFAHLPSDSRERPQVLQKSLRVVDLTSKSALDWGAIVELAGATLVVPTQEQLDSIGAGDTCVNGIDIAIADPEPSKWGKELTKRQATPLVSRQGGAFSVVTVEWLTQSLVAGVQLQPAESNLFSLDTKVEDIYFVSKANAVPVRYTIDDVVQYNTEVLPCLGRIVNFTHGGRLAKVLHVTERPCSLAPESQKTTTDPSVVHEGTDLVRKELEACPEGRCTIIAASKLLCKVLVLPRAEYPKLQYTGKENHIYCASAQWEKQENYRERGFHDKYLCAPRDDGGVGDDDADHHFVMTQGDW